MNVHNIVICHFCQSTHLSIDHVLCVCVISDIVNLEAEEVEEIEIEEVQGGVEEKKEKEEEKEEEEEEKEEDEERYGVGHGLSEYDVLKRQRYIENKGYVYVLPRLMYCYHLVTFFCSAYQSSDRLQSSSKSCITAPQATVV